MVVLLSFSIVTSILCIVNAQSDHCGTSVSALITGGREISKGEYPWLAALYKPDKEGRWEQFCGGAIISPRIVITAAHCLLIEGEIIGLNNIKVGLGKLFRDFYLTEESENISNVTEIRLHSRYHGEISNYVADVALLKLFVAVGMSEYILPVCMDLDMVTTFHPGTTVYVAGWGKTDNGTPSDQALAAELYYQKHNKCLEQIPLIYRKLLTQDKSCTINAYGSQADKGDSGGPLTVLIDGHHFIIGVVSTKISGETSISSFSDFSKPEIHYWLKEEISKMNVPGKYIGWLIINFYGSLLKMEPLSTRQTNTYAVKIEPEVYMPVIDCVTFNIYYYSRKDYAIKSAFIDGTAPKIIYRFPDGDDVASALAVDWIDRKLYWIEVLNHSVTILRGANLNTGLIETNLPTIPKHSVLLTVHPTVRKIYLLTEEGTLESVDLDSPTSKITIFYEAEKDVLLQNMDLDYYTNELCWISGRDVEQITIKCKNVVNGTMRTVLSNNPTPWSGWAFAISSHYYYWAADELLFSLSKFSPKIDYITFDVNVFRLHYFPEDCPILTPAPGDSKTNHS